MTTKLAWQEIYCAIDSECAERFVCVYSSRFEAIAYRVRGCELWTAEIVVNCDPPSGRRVDSRGYRASVCKKNNLAFEHSAKVEAESMLQGMLTEKPVELSNDEALAIARRLIWSGCRDDAALDLIDCVVRVLCDEQESRR